MAVDVEITGLDQLRRLGLALKVAGNGGLRRELLSGLRAAAKPLVKDAKQAALDKLPKAGGLNTRIAGEPMLIRNRLTGSSAGVRIVTTTTDTRGPNHGVIRHPVFGHMDRWVTQPYPAGKGWFDQTLEKASPGAQKAIAEAVAKVMHEIEIATKL
jgi:hypothetical protein